MEPLPSELVPEVKQMGRSRFHSLRRGAAVLRHFEIDEDTIIDRLTAKGCTPALARWMANEAIQEQIERENPDEDPISWRTHRILKALVALAVFINIGIVGVVLQKLNSYATMILAGPFLMLGALISAVMVLGYIIEAISGRPMRNKRPR
jgi:hypothetical protein